MPVVDAEPRGQRGDAIGAVAAGHAHADAIPAQSCQRGSGILARSLVEAEAGKRAVLVGKHQCCAGQSRIVMRVAQRVAGAAQPQHAIADVAFDARGELHAHILRGRHGDALPARGAQGASQRMRTGAGQRRRPGQHLLAAVAAQGFDRVVVQARGGECSGLVEQGAVHAGQREQGAAVGDQHVAAGEPAQCPGQRHRHGQREGTGAGHHQHRDGCVERARGVDQQPAQCGQCGEHQHPAHEAGDLAIAAGDLRAGLPCARGKRAEPGHAGLRAAVLHAQLGRPGQQHAAGHQALAALAPLRARFAGEQRFVHLDHGAFQHAIGRHGAPVVDVHAVAAGEGHRGHGFQFAIGTAALRQQRRGIQQGIAAGVAAMARAQFDVAPDQEQEHEHADRIEIHLAAAAQRVDHAGREHQRDCQRHRQVDAEAAAAQFLCGAAEERLRRIGHQRDGGQQAKPAEQVARAEIDEVDHAEVDHQGVAHHLHRAHAGHQDALERIVHLGSAGIIHLVQAQRACRAAGSGEVLQQGGQGGASDIPDHPHAPRGAVDADPAHAGKRIDALLQPEQPAVIVQRLDAQGDLAQAVASLAQHLGGEPGIGPCRRAVHGLREGGAVDGGGALCEATGTPNTACELVVSGVSA